MNSRQNSKQSEKAKGRKGRVKENENYSMGGLYMLRLALCQGKDKNTE